MAASATIAFRNDPRLSWRGRPQPPLDHGHGEPPVSWAVSSSRLSGAGVPAMPGIVVPSASAMHAMVEAVPIVLQWPRLRIIEDSDVRKSCSDSVPARTSSLSRQTSVPQPRATPRNVPVSIGPPGRTTAGRSTEAAAISSDGIVLSHPPSSTTPSIGLARSISSVAIAAMFRHSMAVGRTSVSPSDTTGKVHRDAARFPDALLDALGDLVQVQVARRQVRGGVRDRDVRPPVKGVGGQAPAHPRAVDVGVPVAPRVPWALRDPELRGWELRGWELGCSGIGALPPLSACDLASGNVPTTYS